jgi:hypothetical protein
MFGLGKTYVFEYSSVESLDMRVTPEGLLHFARIGLKPTLKSKFEKCENDW